MREEIKIPPSFSFPPSTFVRGRLLLPFFASPVLSQEGTKQGRGGGGRRRMEEVRGDKMGKNTFLLPLSLSPLSSSIAAVPSSLWGPPTKTKTELSGSLGWFAPILPSRKKTMQPRKREKGKITMGVRGARAIIFCYVSTSLWRGRRAV